MNQSQKTALLFSLKKEKIDLILKNGKIDVFDAQFYKEYDLLPEDLIIEGTYRDKKFVFEYENDEYVSEEISFQIEEDENLAMKKQILKNEGKLEFDFEMRCKDSEKKKKNLPKMKAELPYQKLQILNYQYFSFEIELEIIFEEKSKLNIESKFSVNFEFSQNLFQMDSPQTESCFQVEKQLNVKNVMKKFMSQIHSSVLKVQEMYKVFSKANKSSQDFKKFNALTESQKLNFIMQKQTSFLKEAMNSQHLQKIQKEFQISIQKIIYNYFQIQAISFSDIPFEKILNKMNREFLMMSQHMYQDYMNNNDEEFPIEITYQRKYNEQQKDKHLMFLNEEEDVFFQKIKEYEKIGLYHSCEKFILQKLLQQKTNPKLWYHLMVFYLRRQNYELAEGALQKVLSLENNTLILRRLQICLYFRRQRNKEVKKLLIENLSIDKWSILDNLLMCLYQAKIELSELRAKKYFRVALKKFCKQNGIKFQQAGDQVKEDLWKELVLFLMKFCFIDLVRELLPKFDKLKCFKLLIEGNISSIEQDFQKSNQYLDLLIESEENQESTENKEAIGQYIQDAILTKACNCYFIDYHYEAEFIFLQYLHLKEKNKKNDILLILGYSYLKRKAFEEALLIFQNLIRNNVKSILLWSSIAICGFYLNRLEVSEEALSNFVKLSPNESNIWALYLLINIQKYQKEEIKQTHLKQLFEIYFAQEIENLIFLNQIEEEVEQIDTQLSKRCHILKMENIDKFGHYSENKYLKNMTN